MTRYDIAKFYGYNSVEEYDEAEKRNNEIFFESLKKQKPYVEKREQPTVDIQVVDRWISVEDRLPDKFDYVLCYCKTTTGEGNEFMFGAYHNDTWWLKTCRTYATLEQPQMRVMYWMPLPEPPKEG